MNILVLWAISGISNQTNKVRGRKKRENLRLSFARLANIDHALCFHRYCKDHKFYYHDIQDPVTKALQNFQFDAVIFDTTTASMRFLRPREQFLEIQDRYAFIADWDAVKIAFPQDEYDCSRLLDDWLANLRFDVVYSVFPDQQTLLYPRMSKRGKVLPALTGYVNDDDVNWIGRYARPFDQRTIDIGYRARFLPANFGSYGQVKGLLAERMLRATQGRDLVTDISTDPGDVFLGDDWLHFLGNCRFSLGSEGGSSLWDPNGEVADRVADFTMQNPGADFAEVEAACFPGEDRRRIFPAVSPRLFEAAMLRSGQILVDAPYLDGLEPWRHYLPIDEHCETATEALDRTRDLLAMERMIEACYDVLIDSPRYRYSTHARAVLALIADLAAEKRVQGVPAAKFDRMVSRHRMVSAIVRHLDRRPVRWIRKFASAIDPRGQRPLA